MMTQKEAERQLQRTAIFDKLDIESVDEEFKKMINGYVVSKEEAAYCLNDALSLTVKRYYRKEEAKNIWRKIASWFHKLFLKKEREK